MLRRWHTRVTSGETFLTMVSEGPTLVLRMRTSRHGRPNGVWASEATK